MSTTLRDDLAEIATRAIHAVTTADLDALREVIHPEAVNREAAAEPPAARARGPEAFHATGIWLREAFADLAFHVGTTAVDGDLVVIHGMMSGRQTGPATIWTAESTVERVFVPTGRAFEVAQAHFQRLRDGMVVEHWAVRDDNGLAQQLGWVPPSPVFLLRCALATRRARRAGG